MKVFDIALKDMTRSFRSVFALAFMFGIPILMTGMFYLMFGGAGGDEDAGFGMPATQIQIVNQDQGMAVGGQVLNMGDLIVDVFQAETVAEYISATSAADPAAARGAVDRQEAGVAVIVPAHFTAAMVDPQDAARVAVELYQDPTLTLGPSVVRAMLNSFMDSFSGTRITTDVAAAQFEAAGIELDAARMQAVLADYIEWTQALAEMQKDVALMAIVPPPGQEAAADTSRVAGMLTLIMLGMMIFYAFFTGTAGAQALLAEEEKGTLPRLFSTPTRVRDILAGRCIANAATLLVQVVVLVVFGRLVFGLHYGPLLNILVAIVSSVLLATSFGIFVISWSKDMRQSNTVFGGLLTITGMVGMVNVFTISIANPPALTNILPLLVPQGWAMRVWSLSVAGADFITLLPTVVVTLVMTALLFGGGWVRFSQRYA